MKKRIKDIIVTVTVTFFYERKTIEIQCSFEEQMINIFQIFVKKLNPSFTINDFDFFFEGRKLDNNSTENLNFLSKKSKITIFVEKRSRIIRCPKCICNDSIINIENYHLTFSGCKYNHNVNRLFNEYNECQRIDLSQIVCSKSGCPNNQRDDPKDFYKCLTCTKSLRHTKYYCYKHSLEHDKTHIKIKYDEKNYYCEKYFHKFIKYCFTCKRNLCHDCIDEHKDHETINYATITPNIKGIKEDINLIKGKINDLGHVIEDIKEKLEGAVKIFEKYCEIANDIIEKYELFNKKYKNYRVLKSIFNIKKSNKKIIDDLEAINKGLNLKDKINTLIDIYEGDRTNYREGNYNKNENNKDNKKDEDEDLKEWVREKSNDSNDISNEDTQSKNNENNLCDSQIKTCGKKLIKKSANQTSKVNLHK